MRPEALDVERTVEYAHMHDMAQRALPWALFGLLLGIFILTPIDGRELDREAWIIGSIAVAGALAFIGVLVYRRTGPNVAQIVLSPRGVLFLDVSDKVIPWREIIEVRPETVSGTKDFFSTRVVAVSVSQAFFEQLTPRKGWQGLIVSEGSPTTIYLAYWHHVPKDELYAAVSARWRALSGRYQDTAQSREKIETAQRHEMRPPSPATATARRTGGVVQRRRSFEGARGMASLLAGASIGQLALIAIAVAGIVALLTNILGIWSTSTQLAAREKRKEWREYLDRRAAEQKAFDAEQKRTRDMWDKTFACMDEYWDRHDRGVRGDPDCMKDRK